MSSSMICACARVSIFHWELSRNWSAVKLPYVMLSAHRSGCDGGGSCTAGTAIEKSGS